MATCNFRLMLKLFGNIWKINFFEYPIPAISLLPITAVVRMLLHGRLELMECYEENLLFKSFLQVLRNLRNLYLSINDDVT